MISDSFEGIITYMQSHQILKILAQNAAKKSYWDSFDRYVIVLNNHLRGKHLSFVEPRNHQHNAPRHYYLSLLSKGFELDVDFNSPLFENRIDLIHKNYGWTDDTWAYKRFFQRLQFFKEKNIPLTAENIDEMVWLGWAAFNPKYGCDIK